MQLVSWQEAVATSDSEGSTLDISLPTLLLDSEVIYSPSAQEAIGNILRQQMTAHTVSAFGGPVPLDVPFLERISVTQLACLKRNDGPRFSVLSYIAQTSRVLAMLGWNSVAG